MDNRTVTIFQTVHPDTISFMVHAPLQILSCTESVMQGEGRERERGGKRKQKKLLHSKYNGAYVQKWAYNSRRKHEYLTRTTSYTHERTNYVKSPLIIIFK
jgi:hypothetical protein